MDILIGYEYTSLRNFEADHTINNFKTAYEEFLKLKADLSTIVIDENNFDLSEKFNRVKTIIQNINPYKITHLRITTQNFYKTIFHGKDINVVVDESISSGYRGGSSMDFMKIIKALEITEEEMEEYIYKDKGENQIHQECQLITVILIDAI